MFGLVLTLPIAQREMLSLAKSPTLYRARLTNSLGLLFLGMGFAVLYHYTGLQFVGQTVFMLGFVFLTICLFVGVHLTADSIAKEKREGTLGLLLLTHQTPFRIVLGKLVAHGLVGFYGILILVPLASLIVIAGGIRISEVFLFTVAALNVMFFSASVGLWASARKNDRKKAGASGTWMVVFFWWGIPILIGLAEHFKLPNLVKQSLSVIAVNGGFNIASLARPGMRTVAEPWLNLVFTNLLGWFFLGMATFYLKRRWQDAPAKPGVPLRDRLRQIALGSSEYRLRLRKKLLDRNPYLWIASRDRFRTWGVWGAMLMLFIFFGYVVWESQGEPGVFVGFVIIMGILHKLMMGGAAGHQLSTDQEQGTLEMLISTPLTAEKVLKGQFLASFHQFRGPAAFALLLQLGAIVGALVTVPAPGSWLIALGLLCNMAMYLFDLYTLGWMGIWGVLITKEAKHAAGAALGRVLVLPALVFGLVMSLGSVANWYWRLKLDPGPVLIAAFWVILGLVNNIFWLVYVKKRLSFFLTTFALRRYSPAHHRSIWSLLWPRRTASRAEPPVIAAVSGRTH